MNGYVEIISPGLYTSIQDKGRFGFSKYGIPKSGAMDLRSFFLANAILNNDKNCAVIEWIMIPPVLKFHGNTVISITGAVCDLFLNKKHVKMNSQIRVHENDVLRIKNVTKGVCGFVGIKHGFQSNVVLGSRSQYDMVTFSSKLNKGDAVSYKIESSFSVSFASIQSPFFWMKSNDINVYKGPEFNQFTKGQKNNLFNNYFTISKNRSRMAILLDESLNNELPSMLTSPVLPGTVQLTPSGQLIILMRDCQTTGGYPRILQLSQQSINVIAQKRVGEKIGFKLISF